ncbi:hypothetical protein [Carnobacterium maltaromaticum]|uniref:hypothetical protein n=1 Tax=Carnobacterium maltaromaticum TaxID=2751 RepID=UPI00295EE15A|nr:hypothetical protein [Carnobacterium maltaromaticum]
MKKSVINKVLIFGITLLSLVIVKTTLGQEFQLKKSESNKIVSTNTIKEKNLFEHDSLASLDSKSTDGFVFHFSGSENDISATLVAYVGTEKNIIIPSCSDPQKLDFLQSRFFYSVFLRSETHFLSKLNWTLPA